MSKEFQIVIANIKNRRGIYLGMAAALLSAGIAAVIPYLYGNLVDVAIKPNSSLKVIFGIILLWFVLSLLNNSLKQYSERRAYEIATDVQTNLIIDLAHHILRLPLNFHKDKKMGKVIRRIDRGTDELSHLIERTVFSFLPAVISFFIALVILFFVEWRLALLLAATSVVYILITFMYTGQIVKKQRTMHRSWERAYGDLWDSIMNIHTVKSSSAEEFERKSGLKNFSAAGRLYNNWRSVWQKMQFWQQFIFILTFIAVFSSGVMMLRSGALTPGKLIMFVGYISLLTAPLFQLAEQYRMIKTALAAFRRAVSYYDIEPEKNLNHTVALRQIAGKVVFENVSFGYKKDNLILKNISFAVQPGEVVALVGKSGVGKTTLVDLIGRYYLPLEGRIIIDDTDIKRIKLSNLRDQMALVPQEILLFNDTVLNNIRYGNFKAGDKQIIEASRAANAHEFIEKFPKQYKQIVGERGIKLSTGQKQRVAIARAILRDPRILILDEATSALDSVSEKLVQEALVKLIKGRTTFIIAHRLSTIQHADKIIVLEKGKIVEMGSHHELMRNLQGVYRNFWELQTAIQKIG